MALTGPRLLVLRALGLGDLLTAVPALRALSPPSPPSPPDAEPDRDAPVLLAPAVLSPLLDLADTGFRVVDTAGLDSPPALGPVDVAVNLHGRGPQSHRVLLAAGPRRLVAFANPEVPHAGPQWRDDEHERTRWCRLVSESLAVRADPDDLRLRRPSGTVDEDVVVVHPGAASAARRWPAERFAEVAATLAAEGHRVVLTGAADERDLAGEVRRRAGLPHSDVLAGCTTVLELARIVAGARLVVCGDTGTAHLASAFATPSVLLFGPTPPERWGPPAGPHRVLWRGRGAGDPHGTTVDPSLAAIPVRDVLTTIRDVLDPAVSRR